MLAMWDLLVVAIRSHAPISRHGVRDDSRQEIVIEVVFAVGIAMHTNRATESCGQGAITIDASICKTHITLRQTGEKIRHNRQFVIYRHD